MKQWDGPGRLIALDLPGFGAAAPFKKSPAMEDYATYVLEFLQQEKIKEAVVLGHSMGGYVALRLAEIKPSLVLGLGLINSHPFADHEIRKEFRRRAIRLIQQGGSALYIRELYKSMYPKLFSIEHRVWIESKIKTARNYPPTGLLHALQAMMDRKDSSRVLSKAKFPVWFMAGKRDPLLPFQDALKMFSLPPCSRITAVEDMAHVAPIEAPGLFKKELKSFLEMISSKQNAKSKVSKKQLVNAL